MRCCESIATCCLSRTDAKWALRRLMIGRSGLAGVLLPDLLALPGSEPADATNRLLRMSVADPKEHKNAQRMYYLSTGAPYLETVRLACGRSPARARKVRSASLLVVH